MSWQPALDAKPCDTLSCLHYGANDLPVLEHEGKVVRVIAGSLLGASSPVRTSSPMFYADISLGAGASVPLDPVYDERAIYTVAGEVEIAGDIFGPEQLLVFRPGDRITIRANTDARFMAWTAPGTFGGISYLQEEIASNKPKLIGRWQDLILYPATPNSSLFPSLRPDGQSPNATAT